MSRGSLGFWSIAQFGVFIIVCLCSTDNLGVQWIHSIEPPYNCKGLVLVLTENYFIWGAISFALMMIGIIYALMKDDDVHVTVTPEVQQQVVKQEKPKLVGAPSPLDLLNKQQKQPKVVKIKGKKS